MASVPMFLLSAVFFLIKLLSIFTYLNLEGFELFSETESYFSIEGCYFLNLSLIDGMLI